MRLGFLIPFCLAATGAGAAEPARAANLRYELPSHGAPWVGNGSDDYQRALRLFNSKNPKDRDRP